MAYTPISGIVPQLSRNAGGAAAGGYYLKGYEAGTTTPLSMGIDSTPTATLAKCKLNARGEPISNDADETTVFIPHYSESYKLVLYVNATDADNNTTANAVWVVDNITGIFDASQIALTVNSLSRTSVQSYLENAQVPDYAALIANAAQYADGDVVQVARRQAGQEGGGSFLITTTDLSTESANDPEQGIIIELVAGSKYAVRRGVVIAYVEYFGAYKAGTPSSQAAFAGALTYADANGADWGAKEGSFLIDGNINIKNSRFIGAGVGITKMLHDSSEQGACFRIHDDTVSSSVAGIGAQDFTIENQDTATVGGIGMLYSRCSHAKVSNVECRDYLDATGGGHVWENAASAWTESGWYLKLRAVNCLRSYVVRQRAGNAGTLSFAYNRLSGTVSEMPVGGIGFQVDDGCSWYGCDTDLNIYMDGDAASVGVNIEGRLNHGRALFRGEKPGGGSHTCFNVASTGQVREQQLNAVFENGAVSIDPSATFVNNKGMIASTGDGIYLPFDSKVSVAVRLASNTPIPTAAWTTLTNWTTEQQRPSGASNWASGVFTAPIAGTYTFSANAAFTPAAGDICSLRISATARDYVLGQDVAETTDDMIVDGTASIFMNAGETAELQAKTSNAAGDTIRASDSDGAKTLFGVQYVAS